MFDKFFSEPPTELLRERLRLLLENTEALYKSSSGVLEEDIVSSYNSAISLFLRSLDGSLIQSVYDIQPGSPANATAYNVLMNSINRDLVALYSELGILDRLICSGFNSILAEQEQILQTSKRISDKLATYFLYADPSLGAGYFFGDSFSTFNNIEVGSSLNDTTECFVSTEEGVVLLPLNGEPIRPKIKSFIINKPSNGTAGNNYELGIIGHDKIEALGDGEPNTWFEYEKVTVSSSNKPLILDLTIVLESTSIVNHININPINFGTPTPIVIKKIDTSKDGLEYTSIMDEVPISDFYPEEEDNNFTLSPATCKSSGQGFYSFLPRKVQYIHIVMEQNTPYTIETNNGLRLRYAIGLRDINILGRKFGPEGSLVSKPFSSKKEIKKLSLWASENPIEESSLADITHSISHDDGSTWTALQPQRRDTFNISEVINFNTISDGAIITTEPVSTLRHKIKMTRNIKSFDQNVVLKREKLDQVDLLNTPIGGNFTLTTTQKPIKETVKILLPFYGSYSCPLGIDTIGMPLPMELDTLEFIVDVPAVDTLRFDLPYKIDNLTDKLRVFVNGIKIPYSTKDAATLSAIEPYDSLCYFTDKGGQQLVFGACIVPGDLSTRKGFLPPGGSKIQVVLDGDNPSLELTSNGYVVNLSNPSDGIKENVKIISSERYTDTDGTELSVVIKPGVSSFQLDKKIHLPFEFENYNIIVYNMSNNETVDLSPKSVPYQDGKSEFKASTLYRYSFDPQKMKLYFSEPVRPGYITKFHYKNPSLKEISKDRWSYYLDPISKKIDTSKIVLDPKDVFTFKNQHIISSSDRKIALVDNETSFNWFAHKLVKGTVKPDLKLFSSNGSIVPLEVMFVDGESELNNYAFVEYEPVTLTLSETKVGGAIYTYSLSKIQNSDILSEIPSFSTIRDITNPNTVDSFFLTYVYGENDLVNHGDWKCNTTTGLVEIFINTATDPTIPHYCSYKYKVSDSGVDTAGLYSVDYKNGIIHLNTDPIQDTVINYEISIYSAFYNIVEVVEDEDIVKIDESNRTITISEFLGMKFLKLSSVLKARPQFIKVIYKYYKDSTESLKDIEPYFSPICKDIALRAVTIDLLEEL